MHSYYTKNTLANVQSQPVTCAVQADRKYTMWRKILLQYSKATSKSNFSENTCKVTRAKMLVKSK